MLTKSGIQMPRFRKKNYLYRYTIIVLHKLQPISRTTKRICFTSMMIHKYRTNIQHYVTDLIQNDLNMSNYNTVSSKKLFDRRM